MTRQELIDAYRNKLKTGDVLRIKHKNMKTVEFFVTGEEESVYQKITGWWISLQLGEPIVQETIKIKKEDLKDWVIL